MSAEKTKTQINIEEIEGFPLSNPKAKVVNDRGQLRVVERNYYWDKEKGRGLEKRRYLGYVVDNVYYDNETYKERFKRNGKPRLVPRNPMPNLVAEGLDTLKTQVAGELPLYWACAEETGLIDDLTATWGDERAKAILSVAFHWLHSATNSVYLYDSWAEGKLLPYRETISAKEMTGFFKSLIRESGWQKRFFGARINRLPEDEVLSFDATQIASDAENLSFAQYGKGKEGMFQNQLGLIVLVGHKTRMPALFRILPGNITDVTTVQDMLFRFDELTDKKRVFAAVLDRGYCSLDNLANFSDKKSRVIVAAKTNFSWVKEAMESVLSTLWMNAYRIPNESCWGNTVPVEQTFPDGKTRKLWVHVYRSDFNSHRENEAFYAKLAAFEEDWASAKSDDLTLQASPLLKFYQFDKNRLPVPGVDKLVQNHAVIDEAVRYFGCFANVTTFPCSATDALLEYQLRDNIEKSFKAGKSYVDMDTVRAHTDETVEGRFIVSFVCMTILNEIYRRMKESTVTTLKNGKTKTEQPLINDMSFNQIKNYMSPIRVVGNDLENCRWLEITKRQHEIAHRLGFEDLYKKKPIWGYK